MGFIILLIILGLPLSELFLLIEVGEGIGGLSTILLCLATAALGLQLIRAQGLGLAARMQEKMAANEPIGGDMLEAVGLAIAGLGLLIPGFLTDGVGFILLVPPLRRLLAILVVKRLATKIRTKEGSGGVIIEGSIVPMDGQDKADTAPASKGPNTPILDQEATVVRDQNEKGPDQSP